MMQETINELATVSQPSEARSIIQAITVAATNPDVNVEKMERLWAMHERIAARDAEQAFNVAMNKAQSEMGRVAADASNTQTRSVYATYAKLDKALRPIYSANGFSLSFDTGEGAPESFVRVLCYVSHAEGHTRTYRADIPADGKGAKGGDVMTKTHATGSAMSYGMRYLLKMIFNVAVGEEDDDGNGADGSAPPENPKLQAGRDAAMQGMEALTKWWGGLSARDRSNLNADFGALRKVAQMADKGVVDA
jgi:hypothetical protein